LSSYSFLHVSNIYHCAYYYKSFTFLCCAHF
jgi:hypothetical protein